MADCTIFLTGGTGFVGRRLVARLSAERRCRLRVLRRSPDPSGAAADGVETVTGHLLEPASYEQVLRGCELIMHLGAVTGKAAPADYFSANVDGTRRLVEAAVRSGVQRMVFISSIAATFPRIDAYPYAQSKQRAEVVVRDSGLNYLTVRPTIVLGAESPIWLRLRDLARLPIMPVIGDGTARVQPIDVDDVVAFLASLVDVSPLPDRVVELGGPETVTFEELLRRIRRSLRGDDSRVVHLPVRPIIRVLASMERWALPILPVTAGQLSAFVNDSVAEPDLLVARMAPRMKTIDEMVGNVPIGG